MITLDQLHQILPQAPAQFLGPLNTAMQECAINTPLRMAMFLAQCGWESASFQWLTERGSPNYEGRLDLGNTEAGDGARFKGRGAIQLTGRANYRAFGQAMGDPNMFLTNPQLVATPDYAFRAAAWYWTTHKLNDLSDAKDVAGVTKKINGGLNGFANRLALFNRALEVLTNAA